MILVDVNLMIYAVDRDSPHHRIAARWFEKTLNGPDLIGLPWIVILAFLRVATRAGILRKPMAVEDAVAYCQSWVDLDSVRILVPGENHWPVFRNLLLSVGTAGNLTSDVHLAALALEYGCTICSADNDYKRFPGISHVNPLAISEATGSGG
jgi:uncharacterized protein